jgi:uncharacterized OB-fold protein
LTAEIPRPFPRGDRDTTPFWQSQREHALTFQRCDGCGHVRYPVGPLCPRCQSFEFAWVPASGRGAVYSYTVVHHQTHPAFPAPYTVLLVEMEEGPRVIARLREGEAPVAIGAKVRVEWDDSGPQPLPVFVPAG